MAGEVNATLLALCHPHVHGSCSRFCADGLGDPGRALLAGLPARLRNFVVRARIRADWSSSTTAPSRPTLAHLHPTPCTVQPPTLSLQPNPLPLGTEPSKQSTTSPVRLRISPCRATYPTRGASRWIPRPRSSLPRRALRICIYFAACTDTLAGPRTLPWYPSQVSLMWRAQLTLMSAEQRTHLLPRPGTTGPEH